MNNCKPATDKTTNDSTTDTNNLSSKPTIYTTQCSSKPATDQMKNAVNSTTSADNNITTENSDMYYDTNMKTNTNNHVTHEVLEKLQPGSMLYHGLHKSLQVQGAAELCKYLKVVRCDINFINPIKSNE